MAIESIREGTSVSFFFYRKNHGMLGGTFILEGEKDAVERVEHHDYVINKNILPRIEKLESITNELKDNVFEVKKIVFEQGEKTNNRLDKVLDALITDQKTDKDYEHELKVKKEERDHQYKLEKEKNKAVAHQNRTEFLIKAFTILGGSGGVLYVLIEAVVNK